MDPLKVSLRTLLPGLHLNEKIIEGTDKSNGK
jgi:hypothetical protein